MKYTMLHYICVETTDSNVWKNMILSKTPTPFNLLGICTLRLLDAIPMTKIGLSRRSRHDEFFGILVHRKLSLWKKPRYEICVLSECELSDDIYKKLFSLGNIEFTDVYTGVIWEHVLIKNIRKKFWLKQKFTLCETLYRYGKKIFNEYYNH